MLVLNAGSATLKATVHDMPSTDPIFDQTVGWSSDGTQIALELGRGQRLAVVDVGTGKVRPLLRLHFASTVDWSADSQELLVKTQPQRTNRCAFLWRVPAGGGKAQLLRRC